VFILGKNTVFTVLQLCEAGDLEKKLLVEFFFFSFLLFLFLESRKKKESSN
jgi:hypothetical protein